MAISLVLTALLYKSAVYGGLAFAATGILRVFYLLFIYPYYVSPLRDLPGPKDHHILLGQHLNQVRSGDPEQPFMAWMRKWPKAPLIRYMEVGLGDGVLINSAAAYRDVFHTHCYAFERSAPFRRLIGDIIGSGLVFAEGHEHRAQRKALGGLFTVANVKAYLPVFQAKAARLVQEMERACDEDGGLVEIKQLYAKITLDVISIFALGIDFHNFDSRTDFLACYETMFDLTTKGMILAAINLVLPIRWLPFKENKDFMHASTQLRKILTGITEDRIKAVESGRAGVTSATEKIGRPATTDLLTYMVETKYLAPHAADRWSKAELIEQALNFMATGHETTAGALTFATHQLGLHPRVVQKLRDEAQAAGIYSAYGGSSANSNTEVSFTDIDGLRYLDNVMRECLRLEPPVAGIPRIAKHDVVVAGHVIPKGTTLMPVPAVIQRNPALWGADADEFRPERWDEPAGGAIDAEAYAWVAFGHGPRACIGKALAALNFKVVMLALVRRFDLESVDRGKLPVVNPSGQLRPSGDVWLRATRVATK